MTDVRSSPLEVNDARGIADGYDASSRSGRGGTGRLALAMWAVLFGAAFHWSYVAYTSDAFSYAAFDLEDASALRLLFSYIAVVLPLLRYDPRNRLAGNYLAAVIYVAVYVPVMLGTPLMWRSGATELTKVQVFALLTMVVLFEASRVRVGSGRSGRLPLPPRMIDYGVMALTALNVVAIVSIIGANFQIVAFSDVYEQRFANTPLVQSRIFGYMLAWQTTFFSPYLIAVGLARKKTLPVVVGLIGSIAIYGSFADKIAILMPALIILIRVAGRRSFMRILLVAATGATVLAMAITATTGWLFQIKSLVLLRTTAVPGYTVSRYHEFFSEHGYTYWSHFRPLNGVFATYEYADRSLGLVIGYELSGSDVANWNANFWASDGIAAAGPEGMLVLLPVLAALVLIVNFLGEGVEPLFFATLLTGFMVSLANTPLSTSLLTGGLVWIMAVRFSQVFLTRSPQVEPRGRGPDPVRVDQSATSRW